MQTGIAIVGCGFVADYYLSSLRVHPELRLLGAFDRDEQRAAQFAAYHHVRRYNSLAELLNDGDVKIVVTLTSPASHFEVSSAAMRAGKHVYSEKPLGVSLPEAQELVSIARDANVQLSGAPCCVLGEAAQTMWRALRENAVGAVRMAHAEIEDGLRHRMPYEKWVSASGAPWPIREERELGCIRAHAGYAVSWLAGMFGPVRQVTAFAARVIDSAAAGCNGDPRGPDVGVACLSFDGGVVARLTCSIVAPRDRSLSVFGDRGILQNRDCSDDRSAVTLRNYFTLRRRLFTGFRRRRKLLRSGIGRVPPQGAQRRDFARGIADLADAIAENRHPRLSGGFCLHVTETVLAIHDAATNPGARPIASTFEPVTPMPWAVV